MTAPFLARILLLLTSTGHAECTPESRVLNFTLPTVEIIENVSRQALAIPIVSGPLNGADRPQDIQLKNPNCISDAINKIDASRYTVLYVWGFVRGQICEEDKFHRNSNKVNLMLEVGDKATPWPDLIKNTFGHDIIFFQSDSSLNRSFESFECESD